MVTYLSLLAVAYSLEILLISVFIAIILSSYNIIIRQIVFILTVIILSTLIRSISAWSNQLVLVGILLAFTILLGIVSYLKHKI